MTYEQFIQEISNAIPVRDAGTSPVAAAVWYVAYQHAIELRDLTTKDLAEEVAAGMPPINEAYVRDWVADQYPEDLTAEEIAEVDQSFRDSIKTFFSGEGE